jgi:hypothetical protein
VFLAKDSFSAGDVGLGLLIGAAGVGLAVGSLRAAARIERPASRGVRRRRSA